MDLTKEQADELETFYCTECKNHANERSEADDKSENAAEKVSNK